jgi:glycosyltransferase involved in cell wall biosynthesis
VRGKIVILIYQTYLPYQGRYPRVSGQAKILQENGFEVTVLACDREGSHPVKEILEGIQVQRISGRMGEGRGPFRQLVPFLSFFVKSLRWLLTHRFDILHCHNLDALPVGCLARVLKRCPVLFDAHEPNYYAMWPKKWKPVLKLLKLLERVMAKNVDAISVTNDYQVQKYQRLDVHRVEQVGNYTHPRLGTTEVHQEKFLKNSVTFGRLGTILHETGFEESVEAFVRIIEAYPQARWLIAGRIVDNYKHAFFRLIEPIRDYIQLMGTYPVEELPELNRQLDVSLLIYPKNAFYKNITPQKFFDSLANGVPVIMTDIGGLGDIIRERNCGLVVDETDIDTITDAMARLIEDTALRKEMARNALSLAKTDFDWETMARRYIGLQEDLMIPQRVRI